MNAPQTISAAVIASSVAHIAPWQETPHYACYGCDHARPFEVAFCPSCDAMTSGYLPEDVDIALLGLEPDTWADLADHLYDTRRDDALLGGGL